MWRYSLMRGAVNGLDRTSHAIFGAMRWGIDRLEHREETRRLQAPIVAAVARLDQQVDAAHDAMAAGEHRPPREAPADEAMAESFPASDAPAGWAGPPSV
jgi:hypothetical protein